MQQALELELASGEEMLGADSPAAVLQHAQHDKAGLSTQQRERLLGLPVAEDFAGGAHPVHAVRHGARHRDVATRRSARDDPETRTGVDAFGSRLELIVEELDVLQHALAGLRHGCLPRNMECENTARRCLVGRVLRGGTRDRLRRSACEKEGTPPRSAALRTAGSSQWNSVITAASRSRRWSGDAAPEESAASSPRRFSRHPAAAGPGTASADRGAVGRARSSRSAAVGVTGCPRE